MSGLNWISYDCTGYDSIKADSYNYNSLYPSIISFFNSPPSARQTGIVTELQSNNLGGQFSQSNPAFTIFTGSTQYTAVKFYGYFCPPTTGTWKFNIGRIVNATTNFRSDDSGMLFLGPPNTNIAPSNTLSISSSPSASNPIIYNTFSFGDCTASIDLIAGNYYPIMYYYIQIVSAYVCELSFSTPSYNSNAVTTDFTGIIYQASSQQSNLPCFIKGTKILTDKGYRLIEDLRNGDLIKTVKHDYKPIDMIGKRDIYHSASQERINDQLYKCSPNEYPGLFEDLILTGGHSILVDQLTPEEKEKTKEALEILYLTDSKYCLLASIDNRASVYETPGTYTIYHLALENDDYYMNYGIYANGLLVESCTKQYLKEFSNMTLIP